MDFNKKLSILVLLLASGLVTSCNTTDPPPPPEKDYGTIILSVLESSCTEAWINIKANGVTLPVNLDILKDNSIEETFILNSTDTTIYIDSLSANTNYNLKARFTVDGQTVESSQLTAKTLNTTSHNFTTQIATFGEHHSSILNDVAIIDENNIWAVGSIYMNDSNGNPDPHPYALEHWNGKEWELKKLYDTNNNLIPSIRGIYYINENNIWLADGGIHHWDGSSQKASESYNRIELIGGIENGQSVNKFWGNGANDIYGVGYKGMITHYNGSTWEKIESGTTTNLNDIWGIAGNDPLVLATVSSRYEHGDYKLLSINSTNANEYTPWPYQRRLIGVWFGSERNIFVVGSGSYQYKNNAWSSLELPTNNFLPCIRGNGMNDIYIAGTSGTFFHFDGVNWESIDGLFGNYEGLSVKGNIAVAAGWTGNYGVVTIIKRN